MWEAKFVISCSHVLMKFLLSFKNNSSIFGGSEDCNFNLAK